MGVESYCVKFYLVRDLWRAWRWRGKEIGTRCLDHGGGRAWLYLGCGCKAGVRVCLSVGKLAVFSGLLLAPDRGKQVLKQRAIVPHHPSSSQITRPALPAASPRLQASLQGVQGDFGFTLAHNNGSYFFLGLQATWMTA